MATITYIGVSEATRRLSQRMFGNLSPSSLVQEARTSVLKAKEGRPSLRCGDRDRQAGTLLLRALREGALELFAVAPDSELRQLTTQDLRHLAAPRGYLTDRPVPVASIGTAAPAWLRACKLVLAKQQFELWVEEAKARFPSSRRGRAHNPPGKPGRGRPPAQKERITGRIERCVSDGRWDGRMESVTKLASLINSEIAEPVGLETVRRAVHELRRETGNPAYFSLRPRLRSPRS
jgi:hypothetical protein